MDLVIALPLLVTLVAALFCARYLWRRQQQRARLLRRSLARSSHADLGRGSPRSEMRYGENSQALAEDINTKPQPFRRSTTPSVGE